MIMRLLQWATGFAWRAGALLQAAIFFLCVPGMEAAQPAMRLYTTADGLVRNWANKIYRDRQGRLWFCTVEGLSLFDGQRFVNYKTEDGLPHRMVTDIIDAGPESYWLATFGGVFLFRPSVSGPGRFGRVPLMGAAPEAQATVLFESSKGEVWCGTQDGGVYRIQRGGAPVGAAVPLAGFDAGEINAMAETADGSIWIGAGNGLIRRTAAGGVSIWRPGKGLHMVRSLMVDRDGLLWAAGAGQISRMDVRVEPPTMVRRVFRDSEPQGNVESIYQDSSGTIWVGAFGLSALATAERTIPRNGATFRLQGFDPNSVLGSQYVSSIVEDPAHTLWMGLSNLGVARLIPNLMQYSESDGLESKTVQSVFEGRDGALYAISGISHALNRFDGERFTTIRPRTPARVTNFGWGEDKIVLQTSTGEWWIATGNGVLRYAATVRTEMLAQTLPKAIYGVQDGIPGDGVTRIFEDGTGDIWIGTAFGIARWRHESGKIENLTALFEPMIGHKPSPLSFAEGRGGALWMGFVGGGLIRWRGGKAEAIGAGHPQGSINGLLSDREGRLWIASGLEGLALIHDPQANVPAIENLSHRAGFRSKHLFALTEDAAGRIYVAGGQGVDRFNPATGAIDHFDTVSGLPMGETQRLFCDRRGGVWFASNYGLARLKPLSDGSNRPFNPVVHEVRVSGASVAASDEGESHLGPFHVAAGNNSIEIGFGSIDFSPDHHVRYRYQLSPMESGWHEPTESRLAAYAGVGPGAYRFRVQGISTGGLTSAETATVEFQIAAPVWQRWWFLMLSGATAAMLLFVWQAYRSRQTLALERVRAHLAADLHDDLGSGLAEIAIVTEVAKQEGKTHDLEFVAQRARELRGSLGDIAWSVDPKFDNVDGFVRQCRQTAFRLLSDHALEFVAPGEEADGIALSPAQRRHLFLMFKEMATNVARHAEATKVTVKISLSGQLLKLTIADDGRGFAADREYHGSGLQNMRARASAIEGKFSVNSSPGAGTVAEVQARL